MARTGRNKSDNECLNDIAYDLGAGGITATVSGSDIEIGAVELKDGATDARAAINAANTARTTATVVVATQLVDAAGNVSRVAVNGVDTDNAASTTKPINVGGLAVTGSTYAPSYTAGDAAQLAVDKDSGGLLCHTRTLTRANDSISADAKQYSTVSTATPAATDATVFTLAAGEKGFIQNLSADAPLAYKLGASASTSSFNGVLNCGSSTDDGKGANVIIDDFVGAVSVAKISGTARYVAYKLS